jgi:hypothetical protein
MTRFVLLSRLFCWFLDVERPLRWEDGSILLSQIWDSPNLEDRSPHLFPPGAGWPSYTPRHWVGAPAKFQVKVMLQLTVSRPVRLGVRHECEAHGQFTVWILSIRYIRIRFVPHRKFINSPVQRSTNSFRVRKSGAVGRMQSFTTLRHVVHIRSNGWPLKV